MRAAIISDIHANIHALEAVLKASKPVDRIVCLGDIVTYGPNPVECLSLIKRISDSTIIGNHDLNVIEPPCRIDNADGDYLWLNWTRQELGPRGQSILQSLPHQVLEQWDGESILLVHNLKNNIYVSSSITDGELYNMLPRHDVKAIAFGHSHSPMLRQLDGQMVINPGSVGQPRDGDPRASYAVWEDGHYHLFRIEYDVSETIRALRRLPLPLNFIERWCLNYREGKV